MREGRLLLQHCLACGHVQYYQQGICRVCGSDRLEHRAASGRGVVYSYSVVHRAPGPAFKADTPYAVATGRARRGGRAHGQLAGRRRSRRGHDRHGGRAGLRPGHRSGHVAAVQAGGARAS
jgi:uncharacterized OB-fold protein